MSTEKIEQYRNGLITANEALMHMVAEIAEVVSTSHKLEADMYWYRLEAAANGQWVNISWVPAVLLRQADAKKINTALTGFRFFSSLAEG